MRINNIGISQNHTNLSFQKSHYQASKFTQEERDAYYAEKDTKEAITFGVPRHSRDAVYKTINDCYELTKRRFPGQKTTVFFNVRQRKNVKSHVEYVIGVGVNSKAQEGIQRSEEELPGHLECRDADFYHVKTVYSYSGEKLNYDSLRQEVLEDLVKAIQEHKNKPLPQEESKEKISFFKGILNKISKKQ